MTEGPVEKKELLGKEIEKGITIQNCAPKPFVPKKNRTAIADSVNEQYFSA